MASRREPHGDEGPAAPSFGLRAQHFVIRDERGAVKLCGCRGMTKSRLETRTQAVEIQGRRSREHVAGEVGDKVQHVPRTTQRRPFRLRAIMLSDGGHPERFKQTGIVNFARLRYGARSWNTLRVVASKGRRFPGGSNTNTQVGRSSEGDCESAVMGCIQRKGQMAWVVSWHDCPIQAAQAQGGAASRRVGMGDMVEKHRAQRARQRLNQRHILLMTHNWNEVLFIGPKSAKEEKSFHRMIPTLMKVVALLGSANMSRNNLLPGASCCSHKMPVHSPTPYRCRVRSQP